MSLENFLKSLDSNQREQLKAAIDEVGGSVPSKSEPVAEVVTPEANESDADKLENIFQMKPNTAAMNPTIRKRPVQGGKNTFVDNGTDAKGEEFETPDVKPVRRRPPAKKKDVTCHVCGRKEKVSAKVANSEYYRCNRCVR